MNPANYKNVAETDNVEVIDGFATFKDNNTVSVELSNGGTEEYIADKIYIIQVLCQTSYRSMV